MKIKTPSGSEYPEYLTVLGIMSGTSLDGLDMAYVRFKSIEPEQYEIVHAETLPYPAEWENKLRNAYHYTGQQLAHLHAEYGIYLSKQILSFLNKNRLTAPDLIASHGQTVFHEPDKHYTLQIGSGAHIAANTQITTVSDFRTQDVALGGQGAPLVPIGDKILFSDYEYCLNIGGFANISFDDELGNRIAFDTGPANIVLNYLARKKGFSHDPDGELARSGKLIRSLLNKLNNLPYFHETKPKSLGWEFVESQIIPLLEETKHDITDLLHTFTVHIAMQIGKKITRKGRILITGGGAYNRFLVEQIENYGGVPIIIPDKILIDFKEALIFALLGLLRFQNKINVLKTVTGARKDHSTGIIHYAP